MLLIDTVVHSIKKCKLRLGNGLMPPASLKKITSFTQISYSEDDQSVENVGQ